MLFNSVEFGVFLPLVFILFWTWAFRDLKRQNVFLTAVSCIFYGWWDPRFLILILISTLIDFRVGTAMAASESATRRKTLLVLSLCSNLGILGFFKYFNFFADSLTTAMNAAGFSANPRSLDILLPVGISFYTLQTLSYTIDVYRNKLKPVHDFWAFSAFVCFFPQLVAGPIERATNLLSQFQKTREFTYQRGVDGLRQILWGMFTKVVIADNCAACANAVFNNPDFTGSTLIVGAVFFSLQVYGDFSGYSNIAIGTAKLLGFDLMQNFAYPYFSRDIAEFWRRWHISLSTWFRDYVYIPLGGSRCGKWMAVRNVFVIFLISGLWHGANWTYVAWGAVHAALFLPLLLTNRNRIHTQNVAMGRNLPNFRELVGILTTFSLVTFAWIFFRCENLSAAVSFISQIFTPELLSMPQVLPADTVALALAFLLVEWIGRDQPYAISQLGFHWPRPARLALYYALCLIIVAGGGDQQAFIYFQF